MPNETFALWTHCRQDACAPVGDFIMKKIIFIAIFILAVSMTAFAQITVSPDNITAYSQGATSAYLTFNNVVNLTPAEAVWCGEIIPAAPDIGFRCDPAT